MVFACCVNSQLDADDPPTDLEMSPTYVHLFLLKYVCPKTDCEGTLVPDMITGLFSCNTCDFARTEAEFIEELDFDSDDQMSLDSRESDNCYLDH